MLHTLCFRGALRGVHTRRNERDVRAENSVDAHRPWRPRSRRVGRATLSVRMSSLASATVCVLCVKQMYFWEAHVSIHVYLGIVCVCVCSARECFYVEPLSPFYRENSLTAFRDTPLVRHAQLDPLPVAFMSCHDKCVALTCIRCGIAK